MNLGHVGGEKEKWYMTWVRKCFHGYNDSLPVTNQLTQLDKSASHTTVLFRSVLPPSRAFEDGKRNVITKEIWLTFKHWHNLSKSTQIALFPGSSWVLQVMESWGEPGNEASQPLLQMTSSCTAVASFPGPRGLGMRLTLLVILKSLPRISKSVQKYYL